MPRLVLGIEYDGSNYCGWQWQPGRLSIQGALEKALSKVANHPVNLICAGRTDAGVHALEQVGHFDVNVVRERHAWLLGGNSYLPDDIRIIWARQADDGFHARYSAIARLYRYIIYNRSVNSALLNKQATWYYPHLDEKVMHLAAQYLVGNHDFSSFRAKGCQSNSPYRVVHFIDVYRDKDSVVIEICANAFLHHMVRNIAGVLMAVGSDGKTADWPLELLEARNRVLGGVTAPPNGLFLAAVCYPEHFGLPKHYAFEKLPKDAKRYEAPAGLAG